MKLNIWKTKGLGLLTGLIGIEAVLLVSIPYFSSRFINALILNEGVWSNFVLLVCCMFFSLLINSIKKALANIISRKEEQRVQFELFAELQQFKPGYVEGLPNGEIGMKFLRDAQSYGNFFRSLYPQLVGAIFGALFAIIAVVYQSRIIAIVFVFFLVLMVLTLLPFKETFARTNSTIRRMFDFTINKLFEHIYVYPFLKSMAANIPFSKQHFSRFIIYRKINLFSDFVALRFETYNRMILLSGEICVLGLAGFLAWKQIISIGDVVFFQVLFLSVLNAFSSIFQLLPMYEGIKEAKKSISELYNDKYFENSEEGKIFTGEFKDIVIKDLSFHYPNSERMIFDNFSYKIKSGSVVAVTGANGKGKTTLFKLLTGYLDFSSGGVFFDGDPIEAFNKTSFREHIAYVFQDNLLITGTLKENITLNNPRYSEKDIVEALSLSGADEVVARVPTGLNYKIDFNQCCLSGGERQKIAIARALIRKPKIIVFDEVTNHLDYKSRIRMRDVISSLRGNSTVFIVSHDPEIIALCDYEINLNQKEDKVHE